MNRCELDILTWLAADQRPVGHLVALMDIDDWVRSHGGRAQHLDAALRIRQMLEYRLRCQTEIAERYGAKVEDFGHARFQRSLRRPYRQPRPIPKTPNGDDVPPAA